MSGIQVFVSFDVENDRELFDELCKQARSSGFDVLASSEPPRGSSASAEKVRRQIREADQVIVICGEHTRDAECVGTELRIAQQEKTPYFLLWGRREIMCTKPAGARPADGMYSWTYEIVQDQLAGATRNARAEAITRGLRRKV